MRGAWLLLLMLLLTGCRVATRTSVDDAAPAPSVSVTVAAAGPNLVLLPEGGLPEGRIRARNIMISTAKRSAADARARMDEVVKKLAAGGDFGALASEYSDDATRVQGGDLGVFSRTDMIPAVADAAFTLAVGQTSPVIQTDHGVYLIMRTQ